MSTNGPQTKSTMAFLAQAAIAFVVSFSATIIGIVKLPLDIWQRGFLAMTALFLVSSTFTLAKVIRDMHEAQRRAGENGLPWSS